MARNNGYQWAQVERALSGYSEFCPREVKAWAMALTILGYSSREVERELRRRFPGQDVPGYSTIARWQRSRPLNRSALAAWFGVAERAAQIVESRVDEMKSLPVEQLMQLAARATEAHYMLHREFEQAG
jgi:hypothetical protein